MHTLTVLSSTMSLADGVAQMTQYGAGILDHPLLVQSLLSYSLTVLILLALDCLQQLWKKGRIWPLLRRDQFGSYHSGRQ